MGNLFTVIGKRIKDRKKNKEIFDNKYWKLSPIERMDYDNKLNIIKHETDVGFFTLTVGIAKGLFLVYFCTFLFYFLSGSNLSILEFGISIGVLLTTLLTIGMFMDLLMKYIFDNIYLKRFRELNKRFKL
jgi:hypothetical protein